MEVKPGSGLLTCISCRLGFKDVEIHKLHYKSDFHRYNLKRRVAELPPVTAEEFQRKVENHKNTVNAAETPDIYCQVCRKTFGKENAYKNHLNSKKHKENEKNHNDDEVQNQFAKMEEDAMSVDSEIEEVDSDEWDDTENPIDSNCCIFCMHQSKNFISNLEHMTVNHSFFIPDIEYCIDIEGLLRYLGEKVSSGFMCIWCNEKGRTFHTAEAARQHMLDKGHCKMIHEGIALAEYADYYDYSSSYPDEKSEEVNADQEVEVPVLDGSDYQLVLPSGAVVGHRSLMKYYKQSLNPNKALVVSNKDKKLHKVLSSYRALGWTATDQAVAAKKARDIHFMKRLHSKYMTQLGVKANKFQKHFRQQVNF